MKLEDIFWEKAREKQKDHGGTAPGRGKTLPQNSAEVITPIQTRAEIAKLAHVSHDTIAKVKNIEEKASEEQKKALIAQAKSINIDGDIWGQVQETEEQEQIRLQEIISQIGI